MIIIEAKERLKQIKKLDTRIKQKERQYWELYYAAIGLGAIRYDKDPVQVTKTPDHMANQIHKYIEMKREILKEKEQLLRLKSEIIREIHKLTDDRYINVLYKRYVEFKDYDTIATEMHYAVGYVKTLHHKALLALSY